MESIKDKVAIIGMGCTRFGELWDKSPTDLIVEAAYEAFEDAGIESKDVQAAWLGTYYTGLTGQVLAKPLQLDYIPITRVENMCATASDALRNGAYAVAAGVADIVLVLGVEKLKDNGFSGLPDSEMVTGTNLTENTYRARTLTGPGHFALLATAYFAKYGLSFEEGRKLLARIAVKNHKNGALHPKAHFQKEITIETALNAPMIASPLGLFDCCGVSDGASAAILCRADMAKNFRPDPVLIKAMQICVGPAEGYISQDYKWTHIEETYRAGLKAYEEAGIKDPAKEISMAEVHDCFSITELAIYEDLQFCGRGAAKEYIESGFFDLDGELPVNTDGGLKCFGHPIGASGLRMMYEVYKQMQGKAGPRQIKNPTMGLSHNLGGTPGSSTISVLIAGN